MRGKLLFRPLYFVCLVTLASVNVSAETRLSFRTAANLPAAVPGQSYYVAVQAVGGRKPYRFSSTPRTPIRGLRFSRRGELVGKALTDVANRRFVVEVKDGAGRARRKAFRIRTDLRKMELPLDVKSENTMLYGRFVTKFTLAYSGSLRPGVEFSAYAGDGIRLPGYFTRMSVDGLEYKVGHEHVFHPNEVYTVYAEGWDVKLYSALACSSLVCVCRDDAPPC